MIKYYEGTVFNAGTQAIVNTVNCIGVMGAGIALEYGLRYPQMLKDYEDKCKKNDIITGKIDYYTSDNEIIINFPTKWHFKYPSKMVWIEDGLKDFIKTYKNYGIKSVAFPKLGTNNGGLNWHDVRLVMERYLENLDIDVCICLDNMKEAEGIEKKMLDKFNSTSILQLSDIVRLTSKQKNIIRENMPYNRFWIISKTESIGIKTYSKLFSYFYKLVTEGNKANKQLSIFDL